MTVSPCFLKNDTLDWAWGTLAYGTLFGKKVMACDVWSGCRKQVLFSQSSCGYDKLNRKVRRK